MNLLVLVILLNVVGVMAAQVVGHALSDWTPQMQFVTESGYFFLVQPSSAVLGPTQTRLFSNEFWDAFLGIKTSSGIRKEWGRLRSKYLNLQREKMRALKKHLARAKFGSNYQSPYPSKENVQQEEEKDKNSKSNQKCKFVPGAIIHIDLDEPLGDSGGFKRNAQSHPGVAYVEANDGDSEVHIRCFTSEVAQGLVNEKLWDNMKILEGEAESNYWKKIQEDRANRIKESKVTHQVRGRNKLLKRAERELGKHIKFDD